MTSERGWQGDDFELLPGDPPLAPARGFAHGPHCIAAARGEPGLDVERLGFDDLLTIGEALLEHYPPDTIVCSHSVKADVGARTTAGIADLIESCLATPTTPEPDQ